MFELVLFGTANFAAAGLATIPFWMVQIRRRLQQPASPAYRFHDGVVLPPRA